MSRDLPCSQERTGVEPAEGQVDASEMASTSAVQQVEEAFGIPVVSVVGLSHLTAYIASKGDNGGADAEVNPREYEVDEV